MSRGGTQYILLEVAKEILWWLLSAVVAVIVMLPLTSKLHFKPFWINGALIVMALTYFRYSVLLKTTFVLRPAWVKFLLAVFNINFFVYVLRRLQEFMHIYDSFTIEAMGTPIRPLAPEEVDPLFRYFFDEINLACVACLSLSVVLVIRMIATYWNSARLRLNAGSEE